ncbi:unnamed protein product [Fusarium graminearum]|nr:unnamed protein product [Fusarium graminearum]
MAAQDNDTYGTLPGTELPNVSQNWTHFKGRIYDKSLEGMFVIRTKEKGSFAKAIRMPPFKMDIRTSEQQIHNMRHLPTSTTSRAGRSLSMARSRPSTDHKWQPELLHLRNTHPVISVY